MDPAKARAAIQAISEALDRFSLGCENPAARQAIDPQVAILRQTAPPPSMESVSSLAGWLDILFSAKKHHQYQSGATSGAKVVKGFVLEELFRIEEHARRYGA
jgi:hypothetical protein